MHADCEGNVQCQKMKVAMWFDMLGMVFWFIYCGAQLAGLVSCRVVTAELRTMVGLSFERLSSYIISRFH